MMELIKRKAEGSIMVSMIYSRDISLPAAELLSSHTLYSVSRKLDHFNFNRSHFRMVSPYVICLLLFVLLNGMFQ